MQNLRRLAMSLVHATLDGCTFVPQWPTSQLSSLNTGAALQKACRDGNRTRYECYFLPLSHCNATKSTDFLPISESSDDLVLVAERTGLRSELLVMGTALAFVMRPQPELRSAVEYYGNRLGLSEPGARHRRIAMHLRRGDKYSLHPKHMKNHSWRIHPDSFAIWGQRIAAIMGADHVLYMTDDRVINMTARSGNLFRLAPAPHACSPSTHQPRNIGEMNNHNKVPASEAYKRIVAHPEVWGPKMRDIASKSGCGTELWADDGIQFFAGVLLLAQCAAFIGLQISNVGSASVELMATQHFPPASYDVLNDVPRGMFLSDERVWINGIHNVASLRPIEHERLARGDGATTRGCWSCTGLEPLLPHEAAYANMLQRQWKDPHGNIVADGRTLPPPKTMYGAQSLTPSKATHKADGQPLAHHKSTTKSARRVMDGRSSLLV